MTTSTDQRPVESTPSSRPTLSVVVPAHDEARTLGRTLAALTSAAGGETPEVVVVANGCSDDTAEVARAAGARVVELGQASKAAALRAGDEAATAFPRVYLDADIVLTPGTLGHLAERLRRGDVHAASPSIRFDLRGSSWPVRAFYRPTPSCPTSGPVSSGWACTGCRRRAVRGSRSSPTSRATTSSCSGSSPSTSAAPATGSSSSPHPGTCATCSRCARGPRRGTRNSAGPSTTTNEAPGGAR